MNRKISRYFCFSFAAFLFLSAQAFAQFTITIPKINKPKVVKPTSTPNPNQPGTQQTTTNNSPANQTKTNVADEKAEQEKRLAFKQEIKDYYFNLNRLAWLHDEVFKTNGSSMPYNDEEWAKALKDLAAIDNLCRTKYAGITDHPDAKFMNRRLDLRPTVMCAIAAEGENLKKKYRADQILREFRSQTDSLVLDDIRQAKADSWGLVSEKVQKMTFERAEFKTRLQNLWQPKFAAAGAEMPADWFDETNRLLDDFKKYIDDTYKTRKWEQPSFQDAAAQALVKQKILAEYKGTQILKIGSSYSAWKMYKTSLGIPTNQFKRGWVLVKHPNRPYCQMREWMLKQEYKSGGKWSPVIWEGLGGGIFMPCEQ